MFALSVCSGASLFLPSRPLSHFLQGRLDAHLLVLYGLSYWSKCSQWFEDHTTFKYFQYYSCLLAQVVQGKQPCPSVTLTLELYLQLGLLEICPYSGIETMYEYDNTKLGKSSTISLLWIFLTLK